MIQDTEEPLGFHGNKHVWAGTRQAPSRGTSVWLPGWFSAVSTVETVCPDHQQMGWVRTPWVIFLIHRTYRAHEG